MLSVSVLSRELHEILHTGTMFARMLCDIVTSTAIREKPAMSTFSGVVSSALAVSYQGCHVIQQGYTSLCACHFELPQLPLKHRKTESCVRTCAMCMVIAPSMVLLDILCMRKAAHIVHTTCVVDVETTCARINSFFYEQAANLPDRDKTCNTPHA